MRTHCTSRAGVVIRDSITQRFLYREFTFYVIFIRFLYVRILEYNTDIYNNDNGYPVFPGGKERPGRDADPSPSSSAAVKKG
jgi:hypothetical protein